MRNITLLSIAAWLLLFAVNGHAAKEFSGINNELFDKAHLKNIMVPGTLHYQYKKTSFIDGNREDTVDVLVSNIRNTGRKDTHFAFFTGKHHRPYVARENQRGNSVFVLYLEFDIHELERLTGGSWAYFQRKIRWSFAKGATKKDVDIDYQGNTIKGVQYTIRPFIDDPKNSRYALYAGKYYMFTLAEDIPGEIYQIRTVVPDGNMWQEGDVALTEEVLTFSRFDPD